MAGEPQSGRRPSDRDLFPSARQASGRARPDRRRRAARAARRSRSRADRRRGRRRRAFLRRGRRRHGGEEGAAGEPLRSRRQGREAGRLPADARAAEIGQRRPGSSCSRAGSAPMPRLYGCPLLGGDSVRTTGPVAISITALGIVPKDTMVRRSGAQAGDVVMVTGTIGDAALGLELRDVVTAAKRWKLDNKHQLPPDPPLSAAAAAQRAGRSGAAQRHRGDGRVRRARRRPRQAVRRVRRVRRDRGRARAAVGGGARRRRRRSRRRSRRCSPAATTTRSSARCRRSGSMRSAPRRRRRACRSPRSGASPRSRRRRASSAATASRCCSSRPRSVIFDGRAGRRIHGRPDGGDDGDGLGRAAGRLSGRHEAAQRFPTIAYLRRGARRHIPHFAFEYSDGGAGSDNGIAPQLGGARCGRARAALRRDAGAAAGRCRAVRPQVCGAVGIPPMGGPAIVWPGADIYMAQAAQRARVPYVLGTVGGITIEQAAKLAPDVLWFQLYRMAQQRPRARLRDDAPLRGGGRACVRDDGRRAGAHGAPARGRGRARRQPVLGRPAHDLRNAALAGLADGALAARSAEVSPISRTMPARMRA